MLPNKQEGKPWWEEKFVEEGARIEHERWAKWQKYLHSRLYPLGDSNLSVNSHLKVLPTELYTRWERQINTQYSELSEQEKESDRKEVKAYLSMMKEIVESAEKKATEEAVRKCVEVCRSTELFKIPLNMWAVGYNDAAKDIALSLEKLNDK